MSFEYFNTSHLAFGSKLTRAFRQLEKLCTDCENNIYQYQSDLEYLGQYVNRNYRVPVPNSPDNPVRTNEIFDVINDEFQIKEISYSDNTLTIAINYFNRVTNRFTIAKGSTTLTEGYVFMKESISNSNPSSTIDFYTSEMDGAGRFLFKFRIDSIGNINIETQSTSIIRFETGDVNHINNISVGENVTLPYTADDYECILIQGKVVNGGTSVNVKVNNKDLYNSGGYTCKRYAVVYLKPDDVLSSSAYDKAYKLIYNRVEEI